MPFSGFIANTKLQTPTIIPAQPQGPQLELIHYSKTVQFSTQPINFAKTDKTKNFELPKPIHTVSTINNIPENTTLISDTSFSDPLSCQFSSLTPSQIASNPFKPPQRPVTNSF